MISHPRKVTARRVMIRAASGGVGLASLQVAQAVGANTVATAGTASKRDLLRGCGHGVVSTSRDLTFVDDCIMVRASYR